MKHDFSKPRMSLLPLKELEGVVRVLEFGAKKYAVGDWAFVPEGEERYFDAALRHLASITSGETLDPESGLHHLDHAITSLIFMRHFVKQREGTDGRE